MGLQGKNKLCEGLDSPYGPLTDKTALHCRFTRRTVDGRGGFGVAAEGVEPRVEHRIKETESGRVVEDSGRYR